MRILPSLFCNIHNHHFCLTTHIDIVSRRIREERNNDISQLIVETIFFDISKIINEIIDLRNDVWTDETNRLSHRSSGELFDDIVEIFQAISFVFSNVFEMNVNTNVQDSMNDIDIYSILLQHDLVSNEPKSKRISSIVPM